MQRLPTETLTSIFRHFCLHCAHPEGHDAYFRCQPGRSQQADDPSWYSVEYRKPLHALCLVSRRLREIAQPILFHEFVLGYGDSWRSTQYSWDRRLTSFLHAVVDRLDLAVEVQRLFLHPLLQDCSEFDELAVFDRLQDLAISLGFKLTGTLRPKKKPTVTPSVPVPRLDPDDPQYKLLEQYLLTYTSCGPGPAREDRIRDYVASSGAKQRYRLTSALFAILVAQLPSLQRLSLQPSHFHDEVVARATLRSVRTSALSRLQTLDISTRDCTQFFNLFGEARAILAASAASLTTLNLHMCDFFWTESWNPPLPNLSALKHINLTRCRLTAKQLHRLLSSCSSGLQSFTFEAAYPYDTMWRTDREHFQPTDVVTNLEAHKDTLKILHLDLRARGPRIPYDHRHSDGGSIHPISSLAHFTALKHLSVNSSSICGSSNHSHLKLAAERRQPLAALLPPNIITLKIAGHLGHKDSPHLVQGLGGLAESVSQGQFTDLKQVTCDSRQGIGEDVASLFSAHGVDFSLQELPLSEATMDVMDVPIAFRGPNSTWPEFYSDDDSDL